MKSLAGPVSAIFIAGQSSSRKQNPAPVDLNHWSSITKQVYAIADMEDSHIENCIVMIKKNPGWRQEYLPIFERELKLRKTKLYKALK